MSGTGRRPTTVKLAARRRVQWPMVVWMSLVWWVLWGTWSAMSLVGGVLVAVLALLAFPLPPLDLEVRVRPLGAVRLLGRFLADVVVASLQVSWTVLRQRPDLRNAVVKVPLRSDSELVLVLVAELVSLVPGSVVVEVHRSSATLFLHVLDVGHGDPAEVTERIRRQVWAQEQRVLDALATRPGHGPGRGVEREGAA